MAISIRVKDEEEFEERIKNKDLMLAKEIVNVILKNLNSKKRFHHIFEIYIENRDTILDLTIDKNDFITTLEKNLKTLIFHEEYEICSDIKKAIDKLKKKNGKKINK